MSIPRIVVEDATVPTRDGALLASDIVRLDDDERRPVLLMRTPYGRAALRAGHDTVALARAGWVVVLQDVRGRWDSTGDFAPFGQEIGDGQDAVAWCAAQPWSSGDVVMGGASYDGLTAWMAARELPPGLRAIAPIVSSPETADPWIRRGGAVNLGFLLNWGLGLGIMGSPGDADVKAQGSAWHSDFRETARSADALERLTTTFPGARPWLDEPTGDATPAFDAELPLLADGLPIFHLTGWHDIFVEGAIRAYRAMCEAGHAGRQRLVIGPWTHGTVYGTSAGAEEYGTEASGWMRFPAERMEFLRAAASGEQVRSGASVWVMGANHWLEMDEWPPPATVRTLSLGAGTRAHDPAGAGTLGGDPGAATELGWQHDASDPVPARGGRTLHPGTDIAGPVDDDTTKRGDVLSFEGEPLTEALTIAGAVEVRVPFAASTATADLVAKLLDVRPDGTARAVLDGVTRVTAADGGTVSVALGNTAREFAAGHRIRLVLTGSNFPSYDLTPSGSRTVRVGEGSGAELLLPVLEETAFEPAALDPLSG
ncbi:MAG: CocE/NonD family hydrolase [Microbacteriaceae bacterium]|nr:MAG: CocE/NonD family hydrolase [Microbacteriaceae bacterium]